MSIHHHFNKSLEGWHLRNIAYIADVPLYGHEDLGAVEDIEVTIWGAGGQDLWFRTATPCPNFNTGYHHAVPVYSSEEICNRETYLRDECAHCHIAITPWPEPHIYTPDFTIADDGRREAVPRRRANGDPIPFGFPDEVSALALARQILARHDALCGPGPWYVIKRWYSHDFPDYFIVSAATEEQISSDAGILRYAGPFDSLDAANAILKSIDCLTGEPETLLPHIAAGTAEMDEAKIDILI